MSFRFLIYKLQNAKHNEISTILYLEKNKAIQTESKNKKSFQYILSNDMFYSDILIFCTQKYE